MESLRPAKPISRRGVAALRGKQYEPRVPGFDYDILDRLVSYGLIRAKLVIHEDLAEVMGADLTAVQFTALVLVGANPDIKQTDLSRILAVTPSAVVALIDALARQGLLLRRAFRNDRRAKAVRLTAKGRERVAQFKTRVMAYDRRISHRLTDAEREQLLALLAKLG
jgi:DNA-binding MarR family transcriptional regulator